MLNLIKRSRKTLFMLKGVQRRRIATQIGPAATGFGEMSASGMGKTIIFTLGMGTVATVGIWYLENHFAKEKDLQVLITDVTGLKGAVESFHDEFKTDRSEMKDDLKKMRDTMTGLADDIKWLRTSIQIAA